MSTNPLMGASWGTSPQGGGQSQTPWLSNVPGMGGQGPNSPGQSAGQPTGWGNPGGFQNPLGANEINRNMGLTNIESGQMKNQLAPMFAQLMQQYGGNAGNFFQNLMNLGSPYYQQQQQAAFTQGNQQNQNAAAQAKQQLQSQGYGNTPSGANAAMIGGMAQQGSQNLAEQYLQNLFQNEQMQMQGAGGMAQMAGMFNPSQLLGGTSLGANVQAPPTFAQNFGAIAGGLGQFLGGASQGAQTGYNINKGG